MSDEWAPNAPEIKKQFKKASEGKQEPVLPANSDGIVTKKEIEKLEQEIKRSVPQPQLRPPGGGAVRTEDAERAARLERMKEQMKRKEGKARNDFGRSM